MRYRLTLNQWRVGEEQPGNFLRFRDKIGVEVALEGLKTFLRQGGLPDDLIRWETTCRVQGILRPYLEAMLA